jgi:hypothetical protein
MRAMVAGASEKIIIQIASFLNVNLSSFILWADFHLRSGF